MMRSLFSGVSGLKSHQTRMDVIGNNIANVNTTGYKSKKLNFSDMLYQTTQAASGPSQNVGGINPRQIGLGVKTAAINTTITQEGATQSTGNPFDLKLTGEAFFVVSDGTQTYYTRDGSFNVDEAGNLCMASTGYIVQGWGVDQEGNILQGSVRNLNVMSKNQYTADATTKATASGIIDETDTNLETKNGKIMNLQILDKSGYEYNLQFGILPVMQGKDKVIENTERIYNVPMTITPTTAPDYSYYFYDTTTSTVTGQLNSADIPVVADQLMPEIDKYVAGQTPQTDANGRKYVDVLLDANTEPGKVAVGTELAGKTIRVYCDEKTVYTDPGNSNKPISGLTPEIVSALYGTPTGTPPVCTLKGGATAIKVVQRTYQESGEDVTEYKIFLTNADGTPMNTLNEDLDGDGTNDIVAGEVQSLSYSDITALLNTVTPTVKGTYNTTEQIGNEPVKGQYTMTLLSMTDYKGDLVEGFEAALPDPVNLIYNAENGLFVSANGANAFELNLSAVGTDGNFSNVSVDMSDTINQFNEGKSSISADRDDGRKLGTMTGVSIANDGKVTANYSNGMSAVLGQICVGTFANAMGLQNEGDNLYSETANSGDCQTVDIKASGTGYMTTGVLEMSNVDLSQEFTDMITTQRGFQANSRIITTSDTLLEELVNLKR